MNIWMVRAGEGGRLAEKFAEGYVAVGWSEFGDMSAVTDKEEIVRLHDAVYPLMKRGAVPNSVAMFHRFRSVLAEGDHVITYDTPRREYLLGTITGDYTYRPGVVGDYAHVRSVDWFGRVSRDKLSLVARNALGFMLTLFSVTAEVWEELLAAMNEAPGAVAPREDVEVDSASLDEIKQDIIGRSHEFIKDKILTLDPDKMEELTAAILRAMGYRARVSPKGPDRGVDVYASRDGLGLETPRIKAEVKHRVRTPISAPDIRSFIGGLREGDRGIYVSTGGFTREARYEADRSKIPVTLVDLDELANLLVTFYESFDLDGRALIPLVRVYWVAE